MVSSKEDGFVKIPQRTLRQGGVLQIVLSERRNLCLRFVGIVTAGGGSKHGFRASNTMRYSVLVRTMGRRNLAGFIVGLAPPLLWPCTLVSTLPTG
eukprot:8479215-Karenia_brevis.AAC.1